MINWFVIDIPYAYFAIAIKDGKLVDAAPIAKWALGKTQDYFFNWVKKKGGRIIKI